MSTASPLPTNTFFAFPEVCGDYFAALMGPSRWWTIEYARIERDGGIPTRSSGGGFEVASYPISSFNPQFCRDVAKEFGFTQAANAEDQEILGHDAAEALRMSYDAELLQGRRQRIRPAAGSVQPRRFYPLPEFDCYVLLTKDPLALYRAPMTSEGGLTVREDQIGRASCREIV